MRKTTTILALILITTISVKAQFDFGLTGIPSLSRFHIEDQDLSDTYIYPVSYGLSVNYHHNRFMFSSGILHMTQGRKFKFEETTVNNPEGTGEYYDVYFRARSIMVPLLANYKFIESSKSTFFAGTGLYTGYIYSEEWEDHSVLGELTEQDVFNEFYIGLNIGIGLNQQISDNLSLQIRPNFLYQLREKQPESTNAWTNRMMTWALDVGIYYRLEKK